MTKTAFLPTLAGALILCSPACATQFVFTATLSGSNEVPANTSSATGFISVVADDALGTLAVTESWSGLSNTVTGAHIHCCAAIGATAPVVVPFTGFPTGTSGSYANTFSPATFATLLAGMQAGLAYANIHTAPFPGGEIRGQLVAATVPETSSWAMMIAGFGLIGGVLRRYPTSVRFA